MGGAVGRCHLSISEVLIMAPYLLSVCQDLFAHSIRIVETVHQQFWSKCSLSGLQS